MSRGYDGPEIDDFRDSSWGRERDRSSRDLSRGRGHDWQTQASTRLKLQQLREAKSRSDKPIAQSCERPDRSRPTSSPEDRQLAILKERDHSEYTDRDRSYSLRPSEIHTLTEVGKLRSTRRQRLNPSLRQRYASRTIREVLARDTLLHDFVSTRRRGLAIEAGLLQRIDCIPDESLKLLDSQP